MAQSGLMLPTRLLKNAVEWFDPHFRQQLVSPIESQFPGQTLLKGIAQVLELTNAIRTVISNLSGESVELAAFMERLDQAGSDAPSLFKQIILKYRRERAANTEQLTAKTFHLDLAAALEQDRTDLDSLVAAARFQAVPLSRLPKLKDYLPAQFIESSKQVELPERRFDEKFHILQAPALFLSDLAYFRAKCEDRDVPLAIAFLDIDNFKHFTTKYQETTVDRNLLPRFMQALEAHFFHHGYAYRQGGEEYLMLIPSLSRELAIEFLDELRRTLGQLRYPGIDEPTQVSIGVCFVQPDHFLTDRELRDRANRAERFAKLNGKNCVATYRSERLLDEELEIVRPRR